MSTKIKVLMVDDEEKFRAATQKILGRRGFITILAASGEEALRKLPENPDVVILDIKMPGMDGHETLKEIRKVKPDLPVIMLTGHGDLSSAKEALADGAIDYLAKPCDIDLLANKIINVTQHKPKPKISTEKQVRDVMIPIDEYTLLRSEDTIETAIVKLKESFITKISTTQIMETGHRSVLITDSHGNVQGFLSIADLLNGIMPAYLSAPKPSTADSIQYSPMFWKGMFAREIKLLANKKIKEVMSTDPVTIDGKANLMHAAYVMLMNQIRRIVVTDGDGAIGVVREQDLFFEMERILGE